MFVNARQLRITNNINSIMPTVNHMPENHGADKCCKKVVQHQKSHTHTSTMFTLHFVDTGAAGAERRIRGEPG
jgi:hypothetical protein